MKRILTVLMSLIIMQVTLLAQNITVGNFQHHKHYFWQFNSSLPLDKKTATIFLKTEGKGFQFTTAKGNPIEAEEVDNGIVLKVADKTKYIVISHPEYGDFAWRVPEKYLKKHNYYTAELIASDLTKTYTNPNQWVVFNISPENAILTLDSVMHRVADGNISLYLPVGNYDFSVESPFYESFRDSLVLTDSKKIEKNIYLKPLYSYLTVRTEDTGAEIFVDETSQGHGYVTLGRIGEGFHRISLLKNNQWVKDTVVKVEAAEKKTIIFPENFKTQSTTVIAERFEKNPSPNVYQELKINQRNPQDLIKDLKQRNDTALLTSVHLIAEDSVSKILVDREFVGYGEWMGELNKGFHLITTEKDGIESLAEYIEIKDISPREILLYVPQSSQAILNIHGNIAGINVWMDEKEIGQTPLILKEISIDSPKTFIFSKEGYKDKKITVRPKGNDVTEVYVELKKK